MELGLNFDDDDFLEKQQEKPDLTSYNAKICYPTWFLDTPVLDKGNDGATAYKFQADYLFSVGEFSRAVECYQQSLDVLNIQNRTMRRENLESMGRCFLHLGQLPKALEYSKKMLVECLTTAHVCQVLILQRQIYSDMDKIQDEIEVLQQLIELHSFHHPFWTLLAQAYNKFYLRTQTVPKPRETIQCDCYTGNRAECVTEDMYQLQINKNEINRVEETTTNPNNLQTTLSTSKCSCAGHKDEANSTGRTKNNLSERETSIEDSAVTKSVDILTGYPLDLMKLTCFVRIRLLLQSSCKSIESFVKDKKLKLLSKAEEEICAISSDEHILQAAIEFMRKDELDLEEDQSKEPEETQSGVHPGKISHEEFNNRWFSWIKQL